MKLTKLIALFLCIFLLFAFIAGCNDKDPDDLDDPTGENGNASGDNGYPGNDPHNHSWIDFEEAMMVFPPDTVMITSGDLIMTWAEFYFFLFSTTAQVLHSIGEFDWEDIVVEDVTFAEAILEAATEEALTFFSLRYGFDFYNFTMNDEDLAEFNEYINLNIANFADKDAFEEDLRASGFYSFDVFYDLFKIDYSVGLLLDELYGDDATGLSDDIAAAFAELNEFLMAMHILISKTGEYDDPLSEAEAILAQLKEQEGNDDFVKYFQDLMHKISEDPGSLTSPNGYLFVYSDMVEPFSDATVNLEIGQMSGIVETTYGYHIILRIPVDYDAYPQRSNYTLRQFAAIDDFSGKRTQWFEALNPVFSSEYQSLNLADIFKWHDEDCNH